MEDHLGSITPGKLANLTVPYTVDSMEVKDIPVLATVYEGRNFPV
jgi:predicted amidohydrolase YtcJ